MIQFAQLQPTFGFFFFNSIRREFTGMNRIQLRIEGSYLDDNLFLYSRMGRNGVCTSENHDHDVLFSSFSLFFNFFSVPGISSFSPSRLLQEVVSHAGFQLSL